VIPTSFIDAIRANLDQMQDERARAAALAERWDRVLAELHGRRAQYADVTIVRMGFDAKIAEATTLRQQMGDVVAGLDALIGLAVQQGPPTVGALPLVPIAVAAAIGSVAGYGVVREITDYYEIRAESEAKVKLAEAQLGIVGELASALESCTGDQCEKVAEALVDVSKRPLTEDPGWPWWVWALVIGLPVIGGVIAWWLLTGDA